MNGTRLRIDLSARTSPVDAVHRALEIAETRGELSADAAAAFEIERRMWRVARSAPGWPRRLLAYIAGLPEQLPGNWRVRVARHGVDLMLTNEDDFDRARAMVITITPAACVRKEYRGPAAFLLACARRSVRVDALQRCVTTHVDDAEAASRIVQRHVRDALLDGLLVRRFPAHRSGARAIPRS